MQPAATPLALAKRPGFQNAWEPDNEGIQNWSRVIGSWTVIGVFSKTGRAGITSVDLSLH
jgi:hypothetical protein